MARTFELNQKTELIYRTDLNLSVKKWIVDVSLWTNLAFYTQFTNWSFKLSSER